MLTQQQQQAVNSNSKNILCLAAAGTGKTYTMLQRIRRMLGEGVDPSSILVLTFTNAAAESMRLRFIKELCGMRAIRLNLLQVNRDIQVYKTGTGQSIIPVRIVDGKEYRVFVNGNEPRRQPHFYFQIGINDTDGKFVSEFESVISLTSATYSTEHSTKKISQSDAIWLNAVFRETHQKYECTNWEYATYLWNHMFYNRPCDFTAEQPDYTQLPTND